MSTFNFFFWIEKKTNTTKYYCINICSRWWCPNVCVTLLRKHGVFFSKDACISVIGCMYIYIWIYISTLMMMMMISWGTFFSEVLSSCFFWKGNNTFDGKIIVTWLKIARLCGCLAYQGHNIYDVRSRAPDWCTWVRWLFFFFFLISFFLFFLKTKVLTSLDQVLFLVLLHFKREETADFFCFLSEWCRCSIVFDFFFCRCLYSFIFERL